jgi:predicted nucleotidyltransferase
MQRGRALLATARRSETIIFAKGENANESPLSANKNANRRLYSLAEVVTNEVIVLVEISSWLSIFLQSVNDTFADRVRFVGLQGSYAREEATDNSDIDVVVVLDELSPLDIEAYRSMLDTLPHRELVCGFFSGMTELLNWEPSDLFQFYYDTIPVQGTIDVLLTVIDDSAVERAIKTGVCNVFHGCVHNMLHEKSEEILQSLYKSATFVVQAIVFRETGSFIRRHKELRQVASLEEQAIVDRFLNLKNGENVDFNEMSNTLLTWASSWIRQ